MGDGMTNTPWDVFLYFLAFGGVPFLLIVVPLLLVPLIYRIAKRLLLGHSDELSIAKPAIRSEMSVKAILVFVGLYYALKALLLTTVGGVSMASVEGVADVDDWHRSIVAAISPVFIYLVTPAAASSSHTIRIDAKNDP